MSQALDDLKRQLARALALSRLDYTDEIMVLCAFLTDLPKEVRWNASAVRRHWAGLLNTGAPSAHFLRLEVVFPFCAQKCLYCNLGTRVAGGQAQLSAYARELQAELAYFAPVLRRASFQGLWVGRGTPTLLEETDLRALARSIFSGFRFDAGVALGIECHPTSVTPAKLSLLREAGFNQISFGVESFNAGVLRSVGRGAQTAEAVENAVSWARQAGFDDLNLDLVMGLYGDSVAGFTDSVRQATRMRPESVTVCGLALTQTYSRARGVSRSEHGLRQENFIPAAAKALAAVSRETGYQAESFAPERGIWRIASDGALSRHRAKWESSEPVRGGVSSQLGVGLRSRSHVFGRAFYQRRPGRFAAGAPLYRGRRLSRKEEMAHYVLSSLNHRSFIDARDFAGVFGAELREAFGLELRALEEWGKIRWEASGARFLPVRVPERVFYAAVFLLDALVEDASLKRRLSHELAASRVHG